MVTDEVETVPGLLARAVRDHPERDAFVFPETRQTYRELEIGRAHV